jgi:HD-like signal output (HDOD) protein
MSLFNLLTSKKPSTSSNAVSPSEDLKLKVGNLNQLPMMPEAATKALAIANDPTSPLGSLAKAIERDPILATGVLHLANSAIYRLGPTIQSIENAVVRLGLRECQTLIVTVGLRSLQRAVPPSKKRHCEILWQHSFLTGCLCRRLNSVMALGFRGEEFASGLAHDIGRILIAIGAPKHFDDADPLDFKEGPSSLERETNILGTDHCYFGAWFASVNRLPSTILDAVQHHHAPEEASANKMLVELVATADHMANHIQQGQTPDTYDLESNLGWNTLMARTNAQMAKTYAGLVPQIMIVANEEATKVSLQNVA